MGELSIKGKWIGQLTYDSTYPIEYRNKVLSFQITISQEKELLKGECVDDITEQLLLKAATIEGVYENEAIYFVKRYPCLITLDERNHLKLFPAEPSMGIEYKGHLRKKLFSKKRYFKGTWDISGSYVDGNGMSYYYSMGGKWKMEKTD
jgi:hypothetical protein